MYDVIYEVEIALCNINKDTFATKKDKKVKKKTYIMQKLT
jgi:hypothetical protein